MLRRGHFIIPFRLIYINEKEKKIFVRMQFTRKLKYLVNYQDLEKKIFVGSAVCFIHCTDVFTEALRRYF